MANIEKKLADYRAKKARDAKISELRTKTKTFFTGLWKSREKSPAEEVLVAADDPPDDVSVDDDDVSCCTLVDFLYYLLWFVLWVILYVIFIEFQFGTVFLIVSAIVFMYVNTRTRPKRSGEVSAYSVFNKNCESIDGALKAEQFEREIRYGPAGVH